MQPFDIFSLFDLYYIFAVVAAMEIIKIYIPKSGTIRKTVLTLLVAIFIGLIFSVGSYIIGSSEPVDIYAKRLFVSFLGVTAFYSLIVKFAKAAFNSIGDKKTE